MSVLTNWAIFLALAGAVYLITKKGKGGEARGRPLQRAANNAAQWVDDEKTKSKPAAKANKQKAPRKSVKKAVQEVGDKAEAYLSAASSNTGADADDDNTPPAASPKVNPSGRDVSDMLEPQAPKSVLRINSSDKPARAAKPQQQRTDSATETKKQRQNRKKKEEEKAARDAAEEERKKLLEQQRRTAREARGEAARNGVPAQAPASNAWKSGAAPAVKPAVIGNQLLDTLDNVSEVTPSQGATNGSTKYSNLPSEEDQMRMAMEESAWTTVPKGGRKKTKKDTAEEGSDSGAQEIAPAPVKAAPVKAAPIKKAENTKPASRFDVLSQQVPDVGDPRDSDWPVV
ncbi:unnamed protein product [Periconia digitata]|uniref:Uncharacterized protein n=1 Tax=Periconia digitata TaxID=1303443 RepID=A0A9W4XD78_9PLEO|nr:unnamed protein product [Periconia digitata]